MNSVASISAKFGVDSSSVEADMEKAKKRIRDAAYKMEIEESVREKKSGGLQLGSNKRVGKNIAAIASDLLSGADAADAFAFAAQRAAASMSGLGLGVVAGVAVGSVIYKQLDEAIDKANELRAAIREAIQPTTGAESNTIEGLRAHMSEMVDAAKKAHAAMKEMEKHEVVTPVSGFFSDLYKGYKKGTEQGAEGGTGEAVASGLRNIFKNFDEAQKEREQGDAATIAPGALNSQLQAGADEMARKQQLLNELEKSRLTIGEKAYQLQKIENELLEKNAELHMEVAKAGEDAASQFNFNDLEKANRDAAEFKKSLIEIAAKKKDFATKDAATDAATGTGESEKLQNLYAKLEHAKALQEYLKSGAGGVDESEQKNQDAKVRSLENAVLEMERARGDATDKQKEENAVTELQLQGQRELAKLQQIRNQYEDKIVKAQRDGNTELAGQLQKAQQLAITQERIANFEKTPAQLKAERAQARKDKRALHAVEHQDDLVGYRGAYNRTGRHISHGPKNIDPNIKAGPDFKGALATSEGFLKTISEKVGGPAKFG